MFFFLLFLANLQSLMQYPMIFSIKSEYVLRWHWNRFKNRHLASCLFKIHRIFFKTNLCFLLTWLPRRNITIDDPNAVNPHVKSVPKSACVTGPYPWIMVIKMWVMGTDHPRISNEKKFLLNVWWQFGPVIFIKWKELVHVSWNCKLKRIGYSFKWHMLKVKIAIKNK